MKPQQPIPRPIQLTESERYNMTTACLIAMKEARNKPLVSTKEVLLWQTIIDKLASAKRYLETT